MDRLAKVYGIPLGRVELMVTEFMTVVISPETVAELDAIYPRWRCPDKRTREGKWIRQLERDICAIAEIEWIHGGDDLVF